METLAGRTCTTHHVPAKTADPQLTNTTTLPIDVAMCPPRATDTLNQPTTTLTLKKLADGRHGESEHPFSDNLSLAFKEMPWSQCKVARMLLLSRHWPLPFRRSAGHRVATTQRFTFFFDFVCFKQVVVAVKFECNEHTGHPTGP